jgi:ArsR family transcriptional regulator
MDIQNALIAFDALSQETRLQVFRLLVSRGNDGAAAGIISSTLNIPHNTLSFHLNHMSNAKLIIAQRVSRSIIYRANFVLMQQLIRFMVENCCQTDGTQMRTDKKRGCDIIELSPCCPQTPERKKP